jgi:hypothetical protein
MNGTYVEHIRAIRFTVHTLIIHFIFVQQCASCIWPPLVRRSANRTRQLLQAMASLLLADRRDDAGCRHFLLDLVPRLAYDGEVLERGRENYVSLRLAVQVRSMLTAYAAQGD